MLETAPFRRFADGRSIPVWSDQVRIPNELHQAVVYLFKDRPSAEAGDCERGATAFLVFAEHVFGTIPYLVTNRHVIEEGTTTIRFAEGATPGILETTESDWRYHSDSDVDVAVYRLSQLNAGNAHSAISTAAFLTEEKIKELELRMGDVCMVGRHLHYDGGLTNIPTSRFGHLVQLPGEPICDDRGRRQSAYLAQIPSLPGFSGSPVFLVQDLAEKDAEKGQMRLGGSMARLIMLLGMNCGHIPAYTPTYQASGGLRNPHLTAEISSGVSVVVPAWKVSEAITEDINKNPPRRTPYYRLTA